jgi:hypothetical protein
MFSTVFSTTYNDLLDTTGGSAQRIASAELLLSDQRVHMLHYELHCKLSAFPRTALRNSRMPHLYWHSRSLTLVACKQILTLQALNIVVYDLLSSSSSASHKHRDKSYYFKAALSNDAPGHVAHPPADVVADVAVGVSLTDDSNNSSTNSNSSNTEQQLSIEVPLAINEEEVLISAYGDPVASHSRANSDAPDATIAATSTYAGKQLGLCILCKPQCKTMASMC